MTSPLIPRQLCAHQNCFRQQHLCNLFHPFHCHLPSRAISTHPFIVNSPSQYHHPHPLNVCSQTQLVSFYSTSLQLKTQYYYNFSISYIVSPSLSLRNSQIPIFISYSTLNRGKMDCKIASFFNLVPYVLQNLVFCTSILVVTVLLNNARLSE